jgi:hypothetical protein
VYLVFHVGYTIMGIGNVAFINIIETILYGGQLEFDYNIQKESTRSGGWILAEGGDSACDA